MPPIQVAHNVSDMSSFNVALDLKLKIQHRMFAPASSMAKTDAPWKTCFQVADTNQSRVPAVQSCADCISVQSKELCSQLSVIIAQSESSVLDVMEALPNSANLEQPSSPSHSPKRAAVPPIQIATPPTASKCSSALCGSSNGQISDLERSILCSLGVKSELIHSDGLELHSTDNKVLAQESIPSDRQEDDRLDEIVCAAQILYSCRNVAGEEQVGKKRRRSAIHSRTKLSRKQSDLDSIVCAPSESPVTTPSGSDSPRTVTSGMQLYKPVEAAEVGIPRHQIQLSRMQSKRTHEPLGTISQTGIAHWAMQAMMYLQNHGQELLSSICAHYRIEYTGDLHSVKDYSLEQLAHNAIFNPALPKANHGLPMMLRDVKGVTDFGMSFVKDEAGITRGVHVTARLDGQPFVAECRACSYCGSCFSGRFMKPNAVHQQAGGWKEITHRTAAGKFSWAPLIGRRLCVPCFTHWAANGTNVNANRPSVDDTARLLHSTQPSARTGMVHSGASSPSGAARAVHSLLS